MAHKTELIIRIYVNVNALKNNLLIKIKNPVKHKKPIIVPMIPRNANTPKLSKNNDLRKLYPAENIIGGKIIAKNI